MKTNKKGLYNYSKLSRTIFVRGAIITAVAVLTVLLFRLLSHGRIADAIVAWLQHTFSMDYNSALKFYSKIIPNNIECIIGIVIILLMLLLFRLLLNTYKKFFDEVVVGINQLMNEDSREIELSSELEFVEQELNYIKQTLASRANQAQQAEQQKNDLVVYLAHDIKTPLTSVLGYLSLLKENEDMSKEQKSKYIHIVWEKANRLEVLVNEFFEITRYNLQTIPLSKSNIDLCSMIVQISVELYPRLAPSGKKIENNIGEDITVYGDSEKLARVFNNILKNAIAYGENNSTITITAENQPGKTIIKFENEGAIPRDKLNVIFDKFYRMNSARSSATGGTGLGLAIAKDIVTMHGGKIKAESDGSQTLFTIELPSAK